MLEQVRGQLPALELQDLANREIVRDVVAAGRVARQDLVRNTSTVVDVRLPAHSVPVRIVRTEFESLARGPIHAGLSSIARLMDHAHYNGIEVSAIVLTGEVARTPLLTELISAQWSARVLIPPFPEWATASGAARIAVGRSQPRAITVMSPAQANVSNPATKTPASSSQARPAISGVELTGSERKWTLRWGAIQLTAALIPDSHRQSGDRHDHRPSLRPRTVPRHG